MAQGRPDVRALASFRPSRSRFVMAGNRCAASAQDRVSFLLGTSLWTSKEKYLALQRETPSKNSPGQLIQTANDSGRTSFIPSVSHCCATPFRLLVQTKGSKGKDARVTRRRYAPNHCQSNKKFSSRRVGPELGSLWRSSNRLAAPAPGAGNCSALCFSFAPRGAGIQTGNPWQ